MATALAGSNEVKSFNRESRSKSVLTGAAFGTSGSYDRRRHCHLLVAQYLQYELTM